MVPSDLWTDIDSRLGEIFKMIRENAFAGPSVMTVLDLLQLTPVRGTLIFSRFSDKNSMKHLLGLQSWHLLKYAQLTKVVKQHDKVQVGNIDDDIEKLLRARFIDESDENYPKDVLHMYAENEPAMKLDIQDRLINCQTGTISHIEFAQGSVRKVYVKFSNEQTGLKAMRLSYLGKQSLWVPIDSFPMRKESA